MYTEQTLLRHLINFNLNESEEFRKLARLYCEGIDQSIIGEYFSGGWREKLLVSFCIALNKKSEYLKQLEVLLFSEINGKQIKGYILAIVLTASSDEAIKILNSYLDAYKEVSMELNWIYDALEWLGGNLSNEKGLGSSSKMKTAINILQ
ncbi:DUF6000 family protein [Chitinophaga pinensis]|uniref:Uncharacterized protein n=1 Tax=Chitinophaga pinensis (strain ATCC 43595 / DSM 2588 / LMG 13176 / NBRC 15968 / NCIMB 11800 / UQM 2034) TaxID=485918 RepID=A0A979G7J3_CHIPD|nr:DUF6000 family protein [Chitinophaga pinensis]ACU62216.1 hypothetical protein Cpin_4782 [Chitinophaga pinensis DSM 2588]